MRRLCRTSRIPLVVFLLGCAEASLIAYAAPTDPAFQQGLAERQQWENWFGSLTGDYKRGAEYWAGHRSLPNPGSCYGSNGQNLGDYTAGCLAAQAYLRPIDARRNSQPSYRAGFNSYVPPTVADQPAPASQLSATSSVSPTPTPTPLSPAQAYTDPYAVLPTAPTSTAPARAPVPAAADTQPNNLPVPAQVQNPWADFEVCSAPAGFNGHCPEFYRFEGLSPGRQSVAAHFQAGHKLVSGLTNEEAHARCQQLIGQANAYAAQHAAEPLPPPLKASDLWGAKLLNAGNEMLEKTGFNFLVECDHDIDVAREARPGR
jgi:hypothetical protein